MIDVTFLVWKTNPSLHKSINSVVILTIPSITTISLLMQSQQISQYIPTIKYVINHLSRIMMIFYDVND